MDTGNDLKVEATQIIAPENVAIFWNGGIAPNYDRLQISNRECWLTPEKQEEIFEGLKNLGYNQTMTVKVAFERRHYDLMLTMGNEVEPLTLQFEGGNIKYTCHPAEFLFLIEKKLAWNRAYAAKRTLADDARKIMELVWHQETETITLSDGRIIGLYRYNGKREPAITAEGFYLIPPQLLEDLAFRLLEEGDQFIIKAGENMKICGESSYGVLLATEPA